MKILHIDEMFHPFQGYQINILPKFQQKQGHDVTILTLYDNYPRIASCYDNTRIDEFDRRFTEQTGVRIVRLRMKKRLAGRPLFGKDVYAAIAGIDPDVILCHGNGSFTSIQILLHRKKIAKPLLFDSHMLELAARNKYHKLYTKLYRTFITPILKKDHLYVIKTADDPYLNEAHGIPKELTPYLGFGTDVSLFHPDAEAKRAMREKYEIGENEMVFLYTGKVDEAKGGQLLGEALLEKIPSEQKQPVFVIVADYKSEYEQNVRALLERSENRVILVPVQKYEDLPAFYQFADVMFFPKQCSLSFFDAQACGVPTVLENIKINVDRIDCDNGSVFESGSIAGLREKIHDYLTMSEERLAEQSANAVRSILSRYSYQDIAESYTEQMRLAIEEFNAGRQK